MQAKVTKLTKWKYIYKRYKCINIQMFPFLSIAFRSKYFNEQPKPICSAVIVMNGKIMLLYCLYISVLYINTEAGKIDSLPYAIIEMSNCYSQRSLDLLPSLL
jgi:hypothetical protein